MEFDFSEIADAENFVSEDEVPSSEPAEEEKISDSSEEKTAEFTCQTCGKPLTYSGRGRKPKFCEDHKTRTASVGKRRNSRQSGFISSLQDDVTKEIAFFGKGVAKVLPTFGVTIFSRAEATSAALCRIAADNPKLLAVLEIGTKIAPAIDLGESAAMFGLALLIDLKKVHPDAVLPQMFGVSAIYHEIHDEGTPSTGDGVTSHAWDYVPSNSEQEVRDEYVGMPPVNVPPRFAPIVS